MNDLRAGAAKLCITPPESMMPAYNTAFHIEYKYVQDDIYVRTLVLESGGRRALFVVIEVNDMGRTEAFKDALQAAFGFERELIFCTVTHTHETPAIDYTHYKEDAGDPKQAQNEFRYREGRKEGVVERVIRYGDYVIERTVECARMAIDSMREARVGCGTGASYINVNRSVKYENGRYYSGVNFEGPSDKTLLVMKVVDREGRLIAALANYAVHGSVCFFQKGPGMDDIAISGDLPGMASAYVEERYRDDGAVCLWTSGAAGDQIPFVSHLTARFEHDGTPGKPAPVGDVIWDICRSTAEMHAVDIIKVLKRTFTPWQSLRFFGASDSVTTARQKEIPMGTDPAKVTVEEDGTVEIKLRVMTVGDMAFLGINGEISSPIGVRLRELSPYPHTFVIPHTAERVEYLPTKQEYDERSTRFFASIVKDGVTEQLVRPLYMRMLEASLSSGED